MKEPIAYLKQNLGSAHPAGVSLVELDAPVLTPLAGDLLVAYLVDEGDHFSYVQGGDLAAFGGSPRALHRRAVENLARLSSGRITMRQAGSVKTLTFDGNFEASLILLDELWDDALRSHFSSAPVVALPSRDVLAFSERSSASGIAELRAVVDRVWNGGDHLLSQMLYVRDDGRWVPLESH